MKFNVLTPLLLFVVLTYVGCKKDSTEPNTPEGVDFKEMNVPEGFDYSTTAVQQLNVHVELLGGASYEGAEFDVYLDNPLEGLDDASKLTQFRKLLSIRLDAKGNYANELKIPGYINKIYLLSKSIGIPEYFELSRSGSGFSLIYNPNQKASPVVKTALANEFGYSNSLQSLQFSAGNAVMNTGVMSNSINLAPRSWSNVGFPDYLTDPMYVNPSFLRRFLGALPKGIAANPAYVSSALPKTIKLELTPGQSATVKITFMFANSSNKNVLGYYWHPTNATPASASAIPASNKGYIFPSTSRSATTNYSGLLAGHTVDLIGPNIDGSFPLNTTIGFFLISNAFTPTAEGTPGTINTTRTTYYSNYNLNNAGSTGNMAGKKERMVTLYDEATNKIVWSIEDGTDGDYSDIAFFATWNPNEAIDVTTFPKLPPVPKKDEDFVFYPAKDVKGTLLFEDCWPRLADFDMNDMVVHHNYVGLIDPLDPTKISEVNFSYDLASLSAQQNNSFGVMVPNSTPSQVAVVTNTNFDGANVNSDQRKTYAIESGHTSDVVVRVFDNASTILGGNAVNNTGAGAITRAAESYNFTIRFNPSITMANFNKISPFIIPRGNRNVETHLANRAPSIKANKALFGTDDDNSSVAASRYYLSNTKNSAGNITWAIDVPQKIPYPKTGESMTQAYTNFASWATSGATSHQDWYTNGAGNRVADKLISLGN